MDFLYTLDHSAKEPIMLIDKHIGMSEEDGEGIMGDKFTRELMFLDTLGKKVINVWVHTPGGAVDDGEQIYNAILKCKTPVDTHNVGMAASIGLPIFLAGRNRFQMDFARNMTHPVSGGDKKSTVAYSDSVVKMLATRSFLNEAQVTEMMNKTTWINAEESLKLGLCTEITDSGTLNVTNLINEKSSYKEYSKIVNKLIENNTPMKKVTNRLKLNDSANEEAILEAIDAIENKYKTEAIENKAKFDKFLDEHKEAKDKYNAMQEKYNALSAKFDEEEKNKVAEKFLDTQNKSKELIKNAVTKGQILNDESVIKDWEEQAVSNFEKVKNMIEKLPINKVKPVNSLPGSTDPARTAETETPSIDLNNTTGYVGRMNAKNAVKALNRFK